MKKILYSMDPENFGGLQDESSDYKKSKVVVFPVPFDSTASVQTGQRNGPRAIIQASVKMELYDEETRTEVWRKGICTTEFMEPVRGSVEENNKRIAKTLREFLDDGKFVVTLGGDHSITTGVLNAFNEKFGKNFSVLQIDAHGDLYEEFEGSTLSHACVAANALKQSKSVVQVGIRSIKAEHLAKNKKNIFLMSELRKNWKQALDKIVANLEKNVYVTLDLDALDPSVMPAVGTPEAGGLTYEEVLEILKRVCEKRNVIGFDCVELMPLAGVEHANATAAKIVYKFLTYKFVSKK